MGKGRLGTSTRLFSRWEGTLLHDNRVAMKVFDSILRFDSSTEAKFRLKVIDFSTKYGVAQAVEAYGVSRASIFRWKKALKVNNGRLSSIVPKSRAPVRKRTMQTHPKVLSYIRDLREKHHRLGKEKIKVLLDEYCLENRLETISKSTIGKIIKRNNFFFQASGRIYHSPKYKRKISYKSKVRYSPKVTQQGYLEIDTITEFVEGIKFYIFNAVDIYSRFQFSYAYKSLSSASAKDFLQKLESVYPIEKGIKTVQTDNGLEYHGKFLEYLKIKQIKQLFIYPRCPKINAYVERANRSLREDFLDHYIAEAIYSLNNFNSLLMKHLVWFNTKRPHYSLGNISPIRFILNQYPESQMYVTQTI